MLEMEGKLVLRHSQALIHTVKLPLQLLGQGSCSQHRSLPSRQHSQSSPRAEGEVGARAAGLGEGRVVSDAMGGSGRRSQDAVGQSVLEISFGSVILE